MPRSSRESLLEVSLVYHIYNRGNGKLEVFHDGDDYRYFIKTIKKYKSLFPINIYHWALMPNHFHFALRIEIPKLLSKCMGGIQQSYAQYHHKRWDSAGSLWQGRFVSQPVQQETYLFECGRYIERNPMRAGLVSNPWEYPWSSCAYYVKRKKDEIISRDPAFDSFGDDPQCSKGEIEGYKEWLMEGEDKAFYNMNNPAGGAEFIKALSEENGRLVKKTKRGRPARCTI